MAMIQVKDFRMEITVPEQFYRCPRCSLVTSSLESYNEHLVGELEKPPFQVTGCLHMETECT